MPVWATLVDSPQVLRVRTPDNRDLVSLSGTAYIGEEGFVGTGPDWQFDDLYILTEPRWRTLDDVAPMASIGTIANERVANNAGWSVRKVRWEEWSSRVLVIAEIGVRDTDGGIYHVAYHATAWGRSSKVSHMIRPLRRFASAGVVLTVLYSARLTAE